MLKREVKRVKNKFGKYLDPFGIVLLILLFVLPTFAVLNLSPDADKNLAMNKRVLGESDGASLGFVMVGGIHDYFKEELLDFTDQDIVSYKTTIIKHKAGTYSKPILMVENRNGSESKITVTGSLETPADTEISLIYKDRYYRLVSNSGEPFTVSLDITANSRELLYIHMDTQSDTAFNNSLELSIVQK